jgi:hypothetical protein
VLKILLVLPALLIALTLSSCARVVTLHPVDGQDIRTDGEWTCMTHAYIEEVMRVRLKQKGL